MSITVSDCLKLPSLREAKLVAGDGGLNRTVNSASVIEYPEIALLSSDLVVGNELLISALVYIKDDVDAQCRLIRHLHRMEEACLILYYTGIFITELDESVLRTANELGFPLIIMPADRFDFRYSDVLTEVIEAVITDQKQQSYFLMDMVNQISALGPQLQTMNVVLRLLSNRIRCTLILVDGELRRKAAAAYPVSNKWEYEQLLSVLRESRPVYGKPTEEVLGGRTVQVWRQSVISKNQQRFYLIALDEEEKQTAENLQQAAEVIGLFLNIWNHDLQLDGTHALIRAILEDQPAEKERLADRMRMDVASIHTIWILRPKQGAALAAADSGWTGLTSLLRAFLQEHHKLVIVDTYKECVIAMMDDGVFDERSLSLSQEFAELARLEGFAFSAVICQGVENTAEAREDYLLATANLETAQEIYREKQIFTLGEIRFTQNCRDILAQGESCVNEKLAPVNKLGASANPDELIQTLCCYLLDAEQATQRTGQLMFLHKNTVKYRINKIGNTLKWDPTQIPETYELYLACALYRLLRRK